MRETLGRLSLDWSRLDDGWINWWSMGLGIWMFLFLHMLVALAIYEYSVRGGEQFIAWVFDMYQLGLVFEAIYVLSYIGLGIHNGEFRQGFN